MKLKSTISRLLKEFFDPLIENKEIHYHIEADQIEKSNIEFN